MAASWAVFFYTKACTIACLDGIVVQFDLVALRHVPIWNANLQGKTTAILTVATSCICQRADTSPVPE